MRDAGHILGSAILEIWVDEPEVEKQGHKLSYRRPWNKGVPIIATRRLLTGAIIWCQSRMETGITWRPATMERFVRIINETIARGGVSLFRPLRWDAHRRSFTNSTVRSTFTKISWFRSWKHRSMSTVRWRFRPRKYSVRTRIAMTMKPGDMWKMGTILDFPNLYFTASVESSS